MKLIIDMPKKKYEWIKTHNLNIDNDSIVGAVANGIPYEEPQGDLISREALKKAFEDTVCIEPMPYAFVKQIIDNAPTVEPNRVLYLCDGHGCDGCDEGTNEDHHCKHTSDITHAKNFEAMTEPNGEIVGYFEKDEHVVAQVNIEKEQIEEVARRFQKQIESGELIVKNSCRPVIIHHNGRDTEGYFDFSRMLLFGSYLAAEVANDFGFTWTEVEEEDENHES